MLFPSMGTLRIFPSISLIIIIILVCLTCGTIGAKRKSYHNSNSNHGVNARTYNGKGGNKIAPLSVAGPERESEFGTRGKICIGTNGRMSVPSNRDHHYRNMKERFTNCTYVDGNLELTWLQDENLDLSFLQYIREVTGYVLISHVDIKRIVLPQLQIIRGRTLFKINVHDEEFALMVTLSKMYSLELPALRDVLNGSVGLFNNYNLCHIKTINWSEIITDSKGKYVYVYNFTSPERECSCDKSCEAGCWGEGAKNCQEFSKINCSPQCELGRCFGPNPRQCCHLFCAGGCNGPKQSDCIACKNFYDDGMCTQECPSMQVYDMTSYSWVPNPNGKYAYGATCVKNCPEHLLKDSGACVRTCPPNKKAVNGECVPCDGPCPKTCQADGLIHAGNIDNYKECTVIEGYVHILENSFKGYQQIFPNYTFGDRYPPMHPDRLEVFSTLKEITGFINIQAYHEDFKNLSYFRNLEVIGGRTLHEFSSLYIVKTSLESLDLRSLKRINSGSVIILENKHLCFANNVNWKTIKKSEHAVQIENNSDLKSCKNRGLICSDQCSRDGCWGPGSDQCLSCSHYQLGNMCLQNCSILMGIYDSGKMTCKPCHEQCGLSCHGPGADNCTTCKNFRDGPFCVSECPKTKYEQSGVCKPCHENCIDGCTGPNNTLGAGGCNSCDKVIMNENHFETCLHKTEPCPDGYFYEWVRTEQQDFLKPLDGKAICRRCHPRCKKCTSYGFHENVCQQCTKYKKGEQCEDECADDDYADETTNECLSCHEECRGCIGPGADNCLACKNFKLYDDGDAANNGSFTCALTCPPDYPHRVFPDNKSDAYCSAYATGTVQSPLATSNVSIMIICGAIIIGVCIFALAFLYFYNCRKLKSKEKALKMTMTLTGLDDNEPLRPSNVMPNLAQLRIIKEIDIRKGEVLGYGAFGTVYKGVWVPEGESNKIPVAIKVLREDTGVNTSKEFLGEAYIMATVDHPNLLQLLAVCMTSQMMLITQLMPLGCLLDFVRNNKDKIGSKPLLTWCTQIAKGMAYLEEKRLVHRDLAARNVLVQTPTCVKITDFGLAKLLDINEEEYKAAGGKMPIKWLALECIQHRIFTHKSDVWAFGVTVWELLTYGGRPYDNVPARDVPELLESGERLPQPSICTIDVYMIMIKCWMLDAESRPGFKELAEDFAKMCRDPGRYLVIQGDKHIRLHNYPNHDDRDTLRSMSSIVDHSGGQIEGDEYLQPKSRAPISISSHSPPSTSMKFWPSGSSHIASDESCAPQNQHNWDRERLRYAQGHGLDPNVLRHVSDGSSIKYCDDSLRKFKANDLGSDEFDSGRSHQAQVGTVKLELLVDEDDYLMPSPQQVQPSTTYVDFGDGSRSTENVSANDSCANMYKNYSDLCKTNIDNPEYLMNNDAPCQTVGIPTVSELVQANCSGTSAINASNINRDARGSVSNDNSGNNVNNINSNTAHPYLPQKSSEEESDHEYYNDIDRLKRELQPLHKSETTV